MSSDDENLAFKQVHKCSAAFICNNEPAIFGGFETRHGGDCKSEGQNESLGALGPDPPPISLLLRQSTRNACKLYASMPSRRG